MNGQDERIRSLELSRASSSDHEERLKKLEENTRSLATAMEQMSREMVANTVITKDIRDILIAARLMTSVIKWSAALVIGSAALWMSFKQLFDHLKP